MKPPNSIWKEYHSVFKQVAVIGLGTLGGFLCKHISELENIKELTIIDHDTVESKNVFKSIYKFSNVGEYKADALAEILQDDVTVTKVRKKYIEGRTSLPKCDLIIDCRDFVYDRSEEIGVRFYISERVLIIDCRQKVRNVCNYEGSYRVQLSKSEINKAAFFAAQIINSDQLENMMKNNLVQRIDLNLLPEMMNKAIKTTLENRIDIIYELSDNSKRLQCIEENIKPIMVLNKTKDIKVFVGEKESNLNLSQMAEVAKNNYSLIPRSSLTNSYDVISTLTQIVKKQGGVSNFIVTVREERGIKFIELLEETGAA